MNQRRPSTPGPGRPRAAGRDDRTRIQGPAQAPAAGAEERPAKGKKQKRGRLRAGIVIRRMLLNSLKIMLVFLCIGLIAGSVIGVQMVQYVIKETENDENLLSLDPGDLAQSSFFMVLNPDNPNAREENDYIEYQEISGDENRIWVSYSEIPKDLINAVIATEDREFNDHHGVNFRRTIAALINEIIPIQSTQFGASTIDQQLVKNITGDDDVVGEDGDRTAGYLRKLREIFRAWGLENRYSKEQIMEAYLNTISLSERLAGVEAGARKYFNKTVSQLTLAECATIAGITRAPTYYSPFQNPENCLKRRDDVIDGMLKEGYITQQQAEEVWAQRDLGLADRNDFEESGAANTGIFPYFIDQAYNQVIEDMMKMGYSYQLARYKLYNGGLRIYLTVDLNVQNALDGIMVNGYEEGGYFMDESRFPGYAKTFTQRQDKIVNGVVVGEEFVMPQAAVVVIDYEGRLVAVSGGIGEKTTSLSLNRAVGTVRYDSEGNAYVEGTVRQVGSTMKPIAAYALGIDFGIIHYSKMIMDAPVQARDPYNPKRDPETGAVIKDWPSNYGNKVRNAKIPVVSALAESTNTVAAQVGMWVGREMLFEFLRDTLEVTSLVEPNDVDYGPLVLGSQTYGMSAYELAGSYMMFGGTDSYGVHNSLHCYSRVTNSKQEIFMEPERTTMQAIDPETGYVINRLLANVVRTGSYPGGASPTAGGLAPEGEMDSIGKTGTTNDDKDRWFVGLTPYYITAIWWGYDQPVHTFYGKGFTGRRNIPGNLWKTLMEEVQADLEYREFPAQPDGIVEASYCSASGNLAQPGCPVGGRGYYTSFGTPEPCQGHDPEEFAEDPPA